MSGDRAVAGSAIGARSAQVNLQAADGTMESAVLHLINAARNDVTGMNYIESGDPKLIPVGEMLRQLAAEQYATADNRAQLTAAHHAIAAKDAQEG